jgi:hypothetical protein
MSEGISSGASCLCGRAARFTTFTTANAGRLGQVVDDGDRGAVAGWQSFLVLVWVQPSLRLPMKSGAI